MDTAAIRSANCHDPAVDYWGPKISATRERDRRNVSALEAQGWEVMEVWECRVRGELDDVTDEPCSVP